MGCQLRDLTVNPVVEIDQAVNIWGLVLQSVIHSLQGASKPFLSVSAGDYP